MKTSAYPSRHSALGAFLLTLASVVLCSRCPVVQAAPPSSPPKLICQGNEPSWLLRIHGKAAAFRLLGAAGQGPELKLQGSYRRLDSLKSPLLAWRGATVGSRRDLVAFISERACADTMNGENPPFTHAVQLSTPDGQVLVGCCRAVEF